MVFDSHHEATETMVSTKSAESIVGAAVLEKLKSGPVVLALGDYHSSHGADRFHLSMINWMVTENVPIDGIFFENLSDESLEEALKECEKKGKISDSVASQLNQVGYKKNARPSREIIASMAVKLNIPLHSLENPDNDFDPDPRYADEILNFVDTSRHSVTVIIAGVNHVAKNGLKTDVNFYKSIPQVLNKNEITSVTVYVSDSGTSDKSAFSTEQVPDKPLNDYNLMRLHDYDIFVNV